MVLPSPHRTDSIFCTASKSTLLTSQLPCTPFAPGPPGSSPPLHYLRICVEGGGLHTHNSFVQSDCHLRKRAKQSKVFPLCFCFSKLSIRQVSSSSLLPLLAHGMLNSTPPSSTCPNPPTSKYIRPSVSQSSH